MKQLQGPPCATCVHYRSYIGHAYCVGPHADVDQVSGNRGQLLPQARYEHLADSAYPPGVHACTMHGLNWVEQPAPPRASKPSFWDLFLGRKVK